VTGRSAAAVLAIVIWSRAASAADACAPDNDPAAGPLAGGTGPADFGAVPEACGATDAALRARASALIAPAMPDYYGNIIGTATLTGRYQLAEHSTLSAAADVFAYRYVDNANLASHGASIGPATVGFHQSFALGAATAAAVYVRLLLPVDTARKEGAETGAELGGAFRQPVASRIVLDGGVSLAAPIDVVAGQTHLRFEPAALAEGWLRLRRWVALGAGVNLRTALAPSADLVSVVPRLSARFALRRRFWTAVLVELPVAGSDRTDLIAGLFAGLER
jgi:hypothetical protein